MGAREPCQAGVSIPEAAGPGQGAALLPPAHSMGNWALQAAVGSPGRTLGIALP